jgi:hypothetical protein
MGDNVSEPLDCARPGRIVPEQNVSPYYYCNRRCISDLMTQKKVLDFEPVWWLEQIGYKRCKEVDDRKHRIG